MYEYKATLLKVIDGDTIDIEIDLGLETFRRIRCRLNGLNAPEMSTKEGKEAKEWLASQLPVDRSFIVNTMKDRKEKYGRYLVEIYDLSVLSINKKMIEAGHAVPYDGGKR